MDRTTLTLIASAALILALSVGWVMRGLWGLLNPAAPPPMPEPKADSEWAEYARACEAERDAARTRLAEVETDLSNQLKQARAELDAAMDGLGDARRRADEADAERRALRESLDELTRAAALPETETDAEPAAEAQAETAAEDRAPPSATDAGEKTS